MHLLNQLYLKKDIGSTDSYIENIVIKGSRIDCLFYSEVEMVKVHFEECPYGCNEKGMLLDVKLKEMVECPYCSKKRKEMVSESTEESEDVKKLMGFEDEFLSGVFSVDGVIPEAEMERYNQDSVSMLDDFVKDIITRFRVGEPLEESVCLGIGEKGNFMKLAYPLSVEAYKAGYSVSRFIAANELAYIINTLQDEIDSYYGDDLVIILLNDGITKSVLSSMKGIMQVRSINDKPTIFITTMEEDKVYPILSESGGEKALARGVFVRPNGRSESTKIRLEDLLAD